MANTGKRIAALALLAVTASAGSPVATWPALRAESPSWLAAPDIAVDVRWVRAYSTVAEISGGICTVFSLDRDGDDLMVLWPQIEQCHRAGLKAGSGPVPDGVVRLYWYGRSGRAAVAQAWRELFVRDLGSAGTGFYFHPDKSGPCYVISVQGYVAVFGHELKHGFDGPFHDEKHRWRERAL